MQARESQFELGRDASDPGRHLRRAAFRARAGTPMGPTSARGGPTTRAARTADGWCSHA